MRKTTQSKFEQYAAACSRAFTFLAPYTAQNPCITFGEALQLHIKAACKRDAGCHQWETGSIAIDTGAKNRLHVPNADLLGPLAVHGRSEVFRVTHRATGYRIAELKTREQAMRMAELLAPFDWDFVKPEDIPAETSRNAWPFAAAAQLGCFRLPRKTTGQKGRGEAATEL